MSSALAALNKLKVKKPADANQESWIVAYADMITLLFIFFALMLSISSLSRSKFELLTDQFNQSSTTSLLQLKEKLDSQIESQNLASQVSTQIDHEGLKVQFSESVLFASGQARLNATAAGVIGQFSNVIKQTDYDSFHIAIEGHTDDRPINTVDFPSNWALSSRRAVNVLHLLASQGLNEDRLLVRAFADNRPVSNGEKSKNRRVTLLVF